MKVCTKCGAVVRVDHDVSLGDGSPVLIGGKLSQVYHVIKTYTIPPPDDGRPAVDSQTCGPLRDLTDEERAQDDVLASWAAIGVKL